MEGSLSAGAAAAARSSSVSVVASGSGAAASAAGWFCQCYFNNQQHNSNDSATGSYFYICCTTLLRTVFFVKSSIIKDCIINNVLNNSNDSALLIRTVLLRTVLFRTMKHSSLSSKNKSYMDCIIQNWFVGHVLGNPGWLVCCILFLGASDYFFFKEPSASNSTAESAGRQCCACPLDLCYTKMRHSHRRLHPDTFVAHPCSVLTSCGAVHIFLDFDGS